MVGLEVIDAVRSLSSSDGSSFRDSQNVEASGSMKAMPSATACDSSRRLRLASRRSRSASRVRRLASRVRNVASREQSSAWRKSSPLVRADGRSVLNVDASTEQTYLERVSEIRREFCKALARGSSPSDAAETRERETRELGRPSIMKSQSTTVTD